MAGNSTDVGRSVTSKVTAILMVFADDGVHTLTEIAEQNGASLADVIDFTNAYNATGYIDMEPVVTAPSGRDTGRGAILSRLRNPFSAS